MNNAVYGKRKKKNRCKACKQQKDYLKWISKPRNMSRKIFDNDLVVRRKNEVTITLKKPAHWNVFWNKVKY